MHLGLGLFCLRAVLSVLVNFIPIVFFRLFDPVLAAPRSSSAAAFGGVVNSKTVPTARRRLPCKPETSHAKSLLNYEFLRF